MNYKRKKNKKRKDLRKSKMSGWGKGATKANKIYYGDSSVLVARFPVKEAD